MVFTSGIPDAASRDCGQPEAVPGGLLKKVLWGEENGNPEVWRVQRTAYLSTPEEVWFGGRDPTLKVSLLSKPKGWLLGSRTLDRAVLRLLLVQSSLQSWMLSFGLVNSDYFPGRQPDACRHSLHALIRKTGGTFQQLQQFMDLPSFMAVIRRWLFSFGFKTNASLYISRRTQRNANHTELLSLSWYWVWKNEQAEY